MNEVQRIVAERYPGMKLVATIDGADVYEGDPRESCHGLYTYEPTEDWWILVPVTYNQQAERNRRRELRQRAVELCLGRAEYAASLYAFLLHDDF